MTVEGDRIRALINRFHLPEEPADIDGAAPVAAAILAEEPYRFRDFMRIVAMCGMVFCQHQQAKGMPEAEALAEGNRLVRAISEALLADAFGSGGLQ